jgi:hypothetical protein
MRSSMAAIPIMIHQKDKVLVFVTKKRLRDALTIRNEVRESERLRAVGVCIVLYCVMLCVLLCYYYSSNSIRHHYSCALCRVTIRRKH